MSKNIKEENYKTAMVEQAEENKPQNQENVEEEPKEEFDLARTVGKVVLIALGVVALGAVGLFVAGAVSKKDDTPENDETEDEEETEVVENKVVELLEEKETESEN